LLLEVEDLAILVVQLRLHFCIRLQTCSLSELVRVEERQFCVLEGGYLAVGIKGTNPLVA
jgi:hypothetical protein